MNNFIEKLKSRSPLIHNITNMVTINDVANIELACGARPIMAMAPQEMDEVTGICDGLNLNIGTPSEERFEAMRIAARMAAKKNIPIVLDLVGVGVSRFRMDFVMSLLDEVHVDVIKGNLSEVKAVMEHGRCDGGVEVTDTADESLIFSPSETYFSFLSMLYFCSRAEPYTSTQNSKNMLMVAASFTAAHSPRRPPTSAAYSRNAGTVVCIA